jgi:hypothetical protein
MDFLHGLQTSLFCFTEPNLQWDKTLLANAKDLQRRFFEQGYLVTSESTLQFPSSYKSGGTCIGVNGKWTSRMTSHGVDPSGQGRWSYIILSGRATDVMFISTNRVCQKAGTQVGPLTAYAQQCPEWLARHTQTRATTSSPTSSSLSMNSESAANWPSVF